MVTYFIGPVRHAHKPAMSVTFMFASSLYMLSNYTTVGHIKHLCERLLFEYMTATNVYMPYNFKEDDKW